MRFLVPLTRPLQPRCVLTLLSLSGWVLAARNGGTRSALRPIAGSISVATGPGVPNLAAVIQTTMAPAARYIALLSKGSSSVAELLDRPDVEAVLAEALLEARDVAEAAVLQAWDNSGGVDESVIDHLMADIDRQFNALPHLRSLIRESHADGPEAVRRAIVKFSGEVALRATLSANMARGAGQTSAVLAAGEAAQLEGRVVYKRWRSRRLPDSCHWCLELDGLTIPLHSDFRIYLKAADLSGSGRLTHPPKPWHGKLLGPLLHPHCQCWLELVSELATVRPAQPVPTRPGFVSARDIRAMPEQQYQAMIHFMEAAVHELRQVLARLAGRRRG